MKIRHIVFALFAAILVHIAGQSICIAEADINLALPSSGSKVYASSSPNPAWDVAQVADGLLDINHGWVASADQGTPWVAFEFDSPKNISSVVLYQAGLTEGGAGRFARPKTIKVLMDGGNVRTYTLQDEERSPQKIEFDTVRTAMLKIDIIDTYDDARFKFLTGFQEVEIYPGSLKASEESPSQPMIDTLNVKKTLPPDTSARSIPAKEETGANIESAPATLRDSIENKFALDGIDAEEREILDLLRLFTEKLEAYMKNK